MKRIEVTRYMLKSLFEEGKVWKVIDGLPKDATVESFGLVSFNDESICVRVESEEFENIETGEKIPEIDIVFQDLREEDEMSVAESEGGEEKSGTNPLYRFHR